MRRGERKPARRSVGPVPLALNRRLAIPAAARSHGAVTPCLCLPGRDARRQLRRPARSAGRRGVFGKKTRRTAGKTRSATPEKENFHETDNDRSARA